MTIGISSNSNFDDKYKGLTSPTNTIVDAALMGLSMNCHRALMNYVEMKRITECISVSNDSKLRFCDQRLLKHVEDCLVAEWTKFFDYINTKRPMDTYYRLNLDTPKRSDNL